MIEYELKNGKKLCLFCGWAPAEKFRLAGLTICGWDKHGFTPIFVQLLRLCIGFGIYKE